MQTEIGKTYTKDGHIHSNFNSRRHEKFDKVGRKNSEKFLATRNVKLIDNDVRDGKINYDLTDQVFRLEDGNIIYVESAVKSNKHWKFIESGVDVETRKLKYCKNGEKAFVFMSDEEGKNILVIDMELLQKAQDHCGKEFKGQNGILNSYNFTYPDHGCHRIRKPCRDEYNHNTIEDFYRIPYSYVKHYRLIDGTYKKI